MTIAIIVNAPKVHLHPAIEKLLQHKARQAEELLKLGARKNDATHAVAQINELADLRICSVHQEIVHYQHGFATDGTAALLACYADTYRPMHLDTTNSHAAFAEEEGALLGSQESSARINSYPPSSFDELIESLDWIKE